MPLSSLQSRALTILAAARNPESYVAGATAINVNGPRTSEDFDIFHDREEAVAAAAQADFETLIEAGLSVAWLRREPGFHAARLSVPGESTRLEWSRKIRPR